MVVSGSRWRCASCESFVSVKDLEHCGLTASLLDEFATEVSSARDRIELSSDKSYRLLGEKKQRYKVKSSKKDPSEKASNLTEQVVIDID